MAMLPQHDGKKRRVEALAYDSDRLQPAQGQAIHRDEIREILMGADASEVAGGRLEGADKDVKSIVEQGKKLLYSELSQGMCARRHLDLAAQSFDAAALLLAARWWSSRAARFCPRPSRRIAR